MLLNQASLLRSKPSKKFSPCFKQNEKTKSVLVVPTPINFSIEKCCKVTKAPFFGFSRSSSSCSRRNIGTGEQTVNVLENGYALQHVDDQGPAAGGGIGIVEFFEGKNIFVTGSTGLLGKVIVEKLVRSTSVAKIYLLIKAKDQDAASQRMGKEIINSDLFKSLKEKYGESYEEFARKRLIPIVGSICEPSLGMSHSASDAIMKDVDVIIESAAITTLNERYDLILDTNVMAPKRLINFAKSCKNLKVFTHISTAYVNAGTKGTMLEKIGDYSRNEKFFSPFLQPDATREINLASHKASKAHNVIGELKRLGQQRAEFYGCSNAYQLTKAMGEMILNENKEDVPLLIIRPSVIESTYKDPFPGWIQGNRMYDPIIISYSKGQLPAYYADLESYVDIIPVDIVASTTVAAIAKHGLTHNPKENVYHVSSSYVNPLRYSDFFELLHECSSSKPLVAQSDENLAQIKCFDKFDDFSEFIRDELDLRITLKQPVDTIDEKMIRKMQKQCKAKIARAESLCKLYEFVSFYYARFHTGNAQKLLREMSEEEKLTFEVDATTINWKKYFEEIHIPGLRKHVLNDQN